MPIPNPDRCCIYQVQENTKDEILGVASFPPPYVVRWASEGKADQQWIVAPEDDTWCRLVNYYNGEVMGVGDDGFFVRWMATGGKEQLFSFVNQQEDWWNIRTSDGKYATIVLPFGPGVARINGQDLLRSGDDLKYQRFKLVPVNEKPKPPVQQGEYKAGAIPDVPRLQGFGHHPPERSAVYLIGETVLPAVLVDDPGMPDMVRRVQDSPYYVVRREQYWDRTRCTAGDPCLYEHDGHTTKHYETEITYGYRQKEAESMNETVGFRLTVEAKVEFSKKISGSVGTTIERELQVQRSSETEYHSSIRAKAAVDIPNERFVVCNWVLVNQYTLLNINRSPVGSSWNAAQHGVLISDGYPRPLQTYTS
jgi:hypothetical protein